MASKKCNVRMCVAEGNWMFDVLCETLVAATEKGRAVHLTRRRLPRTSSGSNLQGDKLKMHYTGKLKVRSSIGHAFTLSCTRTHATSINWNAMEHS
jgi:hypothetical protein